MRGSLGNLGMRGGLGNLGMRGSLGNLGTRGSLGSLGQNDGLRLNFVGSSSSFDRTLFTPFMA